MKEVTKQEFEDFIGKVDFPYTTDVKYFCTPPIKMFYKIPFPNNVLDAEVFAKVVLGDGMYDIVGDNYYIAEGK